MKVIIAGSRDCLLSYSALSEIIKASGFTITEVVSGGCRGVDRAGESWAEIMNVPIKIFQARWDLHGRAAGPIRNKEMAAYADGLIAIWDGKSKGTASMIEQARIRLGRTTYIHVTGIDKQDQV